MKGENGKTVRSSVRIIWLVIAAVVMAWPMLALAKNISPSVLPGETMSPDPDASSGSALVGSAAGEPRRANFLREPASKDARTVANWVTGSADNQDLPFIIIDKVQAKVFVFDGAGILRGATLALLGKAYGDDTVPGIGARKLSTIRPEERTTPAGRFVAFLGRDLERDILWIDYDAAISLHRVIKGNPGDHRLQRLATMSVLDKRISYGCVNVPVKFYEDIVLKTFAGTTGIVYILPEIKTIQEVFPQLR